VIEKHHTLFALPKVFKRTQVRGNGHD
jgi:hypothetical protein